VNAAVTEFRRHWWGLLTQHPEGFPWLKVAGRELSGVTVVDLDASSLFASSEKENAQPTYKGGVRFCPNLATCDTSAGTFPWPRTAQQLTGQARCLSVVHHRPPAVWAVRQFNPMT